jgi:hypothetical protein
MRFTVICFLFQKEGKRAVLLSKWDMTASLEAPDLAALLSFRPPHPSPLKGVADDWSIERAQSA